MLNKDPSSAWGCDTSGNIPPCGVALRRTCICTEFHRVKNANLPHPSAMCYLICASFCTRIKERLLRTGILKHTVRRKWRPRNEDDPTPCAVITDAHNTVMARGERVLWTYNTCAVPYCCNCAGDNTDTSGSFCLLLRSLSCGYESAPYPLFTLYRSVVSTYILSRRLGWGSRYGDLLRDGQSGDRIPVEAKLFVPVLTGPLYHLASCTMSAVFSGGKMAGVWCWRSNPFHRRICKWDGDIIPSPSMPS